MRITLIAIALSIAFESFACAEVGVGVGVEVEVEVERTPSDDATVHARVIRIIDGDSIEVEESDRTTSTIRLAQIDAPESQQAFGAQATQALSQLVLGRDVLIEIVDRDRYGRRVGEVHRGETHVNLEMVRLGFAWAYTTYVRSMTVVHLEDEARKAGVGLWSLPASDRDPPWQWRSERRDASKRTRGAEDVVDIRCGRKATCGAMSSCAEAIAYLTQCQLTTLDRDRDGIPCESLCGSR